MSTTFSAHVLDAERGRPAFGMQLVLTFPDGSTHSGATDADGRIRFEKPIPAGVHSLAFETGAWFAVQQRVTFYPRIDVTFTAVEDEHHHVALLLSPFAYTTYKGS